MKKILIIGAGISGLTAAYRLQSEGYDVTIVESSKVPGGWVRTLVDPNEGNIEKGPQLIAVESGTPLRYLLDSLGVPLTIHRNLSRFIGIDGKLVRVPRSVSELFSSPLLTLKGKLRIFLEPLLCYFLNKNKEYTLHEAIGNRFGFEIADRLAPAIVNGILAAPPNEVSQESIPLFRMANEGSVLWRSIMRGHTVLSTPTGGMGELTQALASKCSIIFNTEITSLNYSQSYWHASGPTYDGKFDSILLAIPAPKAAALLSLISPRLSAILKKIEYTSLYSFHSTHAYNNTLDNSLGFLLHPSESEFLLGCFVSSSLTIPDKDKTIKLRTFVKINQNSIPRWQDIYSELIKWVPDLSPSNSCHIETASLAIPIMRVGQFPEIVRALEDLPSGLDWIGGARFGPGVKDIVDGIDSWMSTSRMHA